MSAAIHVRTRVLPGKRIEVSSGGLVEGQPVDVFIVMPEPTNTRQGSVLQMLRSAPAPRVFTTSDEVDEYIRKERDEWDR